MRVRFSPETVPREPAQPSQPQQPLSRSSSFSQRRMHARELDDPLSSSYGRPRASPPSPSLTRSRPPEPSLFSSSLSASLGLSPTQSQPLRRSLQTHSLSHSQTHSVHMSRPRHSSPPASVLRDVRFSPLPVRSLSSSPLRSSPSSLHRHSARVMPLSQAPAELQRLLARYGPTSPRPHLVADTYSASLYSSLPISAPTSPSASGRFSSLGPASVAPAATDDMSSLQRQVSSLQAQLERLQREASVHTSANASLAAAYRSIEFENEHLHAALAARNLALVRTEDERRALENTMSSTMNAVQQEAANEEAMASRERNRAQAELRAVLEASRRDLVAQQQHLQAREDQMEQLLRDTNAAHEAHLAERLAEMEQAHAAHLAEQMAEAEQHADQVSGQIAEAERALTEQLAEASAAHANDLAERLTEQAHLKHAEFDVAIRQLEVANQARRERERLDMAEEQAQQLEAMQEEQDRQRAALEREHAERLEVLQEEQEHQQLTYASENQRQVSSWQIKYDALSETAATMAQERAQLRRILMAQTRARRANATVDASQPDSLTELQALPSAISSHPLVIGHALLFHSWRHESARAHAEQARTRPTAELQQRVLHRALQRLRNLSLFHAVRVWKAATDTEALLVTHAHLNHQKRARLHLLLHRARCDGTTGPFAAWKTWALTRASRRRELLSRILRVSINRNQAATLLIWRSFVAAPHVAAARASLNKLKRHRADSLVLGARVTGQTPVFHAWRDVVLSARRERIAVDRERLKLRTLGRAVQRQVDASLGQTLRSWRAWSVAQTSSSLRAQLAHQKRSRACELITRWRHSALAPTFLAWSAEARQKRLQLTERTVALHRVADRAVHRVILQAVRNWRVFALRERDAEHAASLRSALTFEKRKRAATLIDQWRQASLVPTFQFWARRAASGRRQRAQNLERRQELLRRGMRRLARTHLARAWRCWTSTVEDVRIGLLQNALGTARAAIQTEKRKRAWTAIATWRMRSIEPAFRAWRLRVARTKERKGLALRDVQQTKVVAHLRADLATHKRARAHAAIVVWRVQAVLPAFHAWRSRARATKTRRLLVLRAVLDRHCRTALGSVLAQWHRFSTFSAAAAYRADLAAQHDHLGLQLLDQKRRRYAAMLTKWRLRREETARTVIKAWTAWAARTATQQRDMRSRVLARRIVASQAKVFRAWTTSVARGKLRSARYALQDSKVLALELRSRRHALAPVFHSWNIRVRDCHMRRRELLASIFGRQVHRTLFAAFGTWMRFVAGHYARELREQINIQKRARVEALVELKRNASIVPAFHAWHSWVSTTRKSKRDSLTHLLRRQTQRALAQAFNTWISFNASTRLAVANVYHARLIIDQKQARARHMIETWRHRGEAPVFAAWRAFTRDMRRKKKELLGKAFRRQLQREAIHVLRVWRDFSSAHAIGELRSQLNGEKRRRVIDLVTSRVNTRQAPVFRRWAAYAARTRAERADAQQERLVALDRAGRRATLRAARRAMRLWAAATTSHRVRTICDEAREARARGARQLVGRLGIEAERHAFRGWLASARAQADHRAQAYEERLHTLRRTVRRCERTGLASALARWVATMIAQDAAADIRAADERAHDLVLQLAAQADLTTAAVSQVAVVQAKLDEQVEVVAYLHKVVHNSV